MPNALKTVAPDGVTLNYLDSGSGDPPLMFIHGWCCDHTYWSDQTAHFAQTNRVVAPDLRGFGESDKPDQQYTMDGFADDVAWLAGELELDRPVIIGHSMGGVIALEISARFPDLPSAVVLVDAPVVPPAALVDGVRPLMEALRSPNYREAQRQFVADALFLPGDDPQRKAQIVDAMSQAPQHVMASAFENIFSWDGEAAARGCTVPVLNICAAGPLTDLTRFRELCPQLVNGQTVGAGHFHQLEVPEQVNAMIDRFLAVSVPRPAATA
jgi:pimeloyl-ACP methyl ester carboxylesterase